MGDFLKEVFGGSTAKTQSTSSPVDLTPEALKALREPFASFLSSQLQTGGPQYKGPLSTTPGANETDILSQLMSQTGAETARSGLLDKTLSGDFLPGGQNANPFLQAAIEAAQRPTLQGLEETLSRALPGRFTQGGQMIQADSGGGGGGSSAFDRAAAIATRGVSQSLADIASNISFGAYQGERQAQMQAIPLSREEVNASIQNLQAQALPRLIQELGIDRGIEVFKTQTSALLDLLRTIGGVSAPVVAQQAQSTGEGDTSKGIFPALFPKGI